VQDRAAARLALRVLEHLLRRGLRGKKRGAHVEVEQAIEMVFAHLDEGLRDVAAGVVDEDVEHRDLFK
jgi:hypothetical protein